MRIARLLIQLAAMLAFPASAAAPGLDSLLSYPFASNLVAAPDGHQIAWIESVEGRRTIWSAQGPGFFARPLARFPDDGQEITELTFDPTSRRLLFVRGGDHDANWLGLHGSAPNTSSSVSPPEVEIWAVPLNGGSARVLAQGDGPAVSSTGDVAFLRDGAVWHLPPKREARAERLFGDRGTDRALAWSPDGRRLAFVSDRDDHSFIGIFTKERASLLWLAPSTARDDDLVWSPDGTKVAFTRRAGIGGTPAPLLKVVPQPFAIWVADAESGAGHAAWASPYTLDGSYPQDGDGVDLRWPRPDKLVFVATLDGWEHLYALPVSGGTPRLLTPGRFMVEHVAVADDKTSLLYAANAGPRLDDGDRRHVFRVDLDDGRPQLLCDEDASQWSPVSAGQGVAFISADARSPTRVRRLSEGRSKSLSPATGYPSAALVVPTRVRLRSTDGLEVEGQLFASGGEAGQRPAVVFVHGGPERQMLLGWHYKDYYANAYAVNQYLALHGFVVLSVNYRLGVGYGRAFEQPDGAGPAGAAEYQDVLAAARYLQHLPGVDSRRIGIWGGSYGGYLTALALARNSDTFKAGVDFHGVHDWSRYIAEDKGPPLRRYEVGDWDEAMKTAFDASPVASMATWRAPILLIHGDDDRNVRFNQTIDLVNRLQDGGHTYEELVIPDEIHGFLRYSDWLRTDTATVDFLKRKLGQ